MRYSMLTFSSQVVDPILVYFKPLAPEILSSCSSLNQRIKDEPTQVPFRLARPAMPGAEIVGRNHAAEHPRQWQPSDC